MMRVAYARVIELGDHPRGMFGVAVARDDRHAPCMWQWSSYYEAVDGRAPRPLLDDVLRRFAGDADGTPPSRPRAAVDLGSGDGTEAVALLDAGWRVYAVDSEPAAARRLTGKIDTVAARRLSIVTADLAGYEPPPADLVWASLSLLFVEPVGLATLWRRIRGALCPGGRFAGHFLGVHDTWADAPGTSAFDEQEVRTMMDGLEIERFVVRDEDGLAVSGPKHWHIFEVVARRPGAML